MWVVLVVIVVAVVVFFVKRNNEMAVAPADTTVLITATTTTDTTDANAPAESVQDTTPAVGVAPVTISYANALVQYADRRIQLDGTCQARPHQVTYKDNTGIMIDNRSPLTRTITVGTTFTIKPYGFRIVTLPDVYLKNKTLLVDCDGYKNVATILVQE